MPAYPITIDFGGGLSPNQKAAFTKARQRWSRVITAPLTRVRISDGRETDGVIISAAGMNIDGAGSILGQAGPLDLRPSSLLPASGAMEFDSADLAQMEADQTLEAVIFHEMGHVLGIGTIWGGRNLIVGSGSSNPRFKGNSAKREFGVLVNDPTPTLTPIENQGGQGTREGHWRDTVFGTEIMTSFIAGTSNPLSRMTIASLEDLGYSVDFSQADPYAIPTALQLALLGVGGNPERMYKCSQCGGRTRPTVPRVLPNSSIVKSKAAKKVGNTKRSK